MLSIVLGNIVKCEVDAIVNAANEWMLGGGGVDGAIHSAAGPKLMEACKEIKEVQPGVRCPRGEARITSAGNLSAKYVIHTVGPVWIDGERKEPEILASCYKNSLSLAKENGLKSVAFPAISCGVYGYPIDKAADVAINEVCNFLDENPDFEITLIAYEADVKSSLIEALKKRQSSWN